MQPEQSGICPYIQAVLFQFTYVNPISFERLLSFKPPKFKKVIEHEI